MKDVLVVFSHGKESGPMGSKIRALIQVAENLGAKAVSVDYREYPVGIFHDQNAAGEADRRIEQLLSTDLPERHQLVLVGSSMGGYVSTVASRQMSVAGLFLLAPAFYLPGYAIQEFEPSTSDTMVVHGWRDDVVPVQNSIRFAQRKRVAKSSCWNRHFSRASCPLQLRWTHAHSRNSNAAGGTLPRTLQ